MNDRLDGIGVRSHSLSARSVKLNFIDKYRKIFCFISAFKKFGGAAGVEPATGRD